MLRSPSRSTFAGEYLQNICSPVAELSYTPCSPESIDPFNQRYSGLLLNKKKIKKRDAECRGVSAGHGINCFENLRNFMGTIWKIVQFWGVSRGILSIPPPLAIFS